MNSSYEGLAADEVASALGWFSLGLGLAEIAAPRAITRAVGLEGHELLIQSYGAREIAAGVGILASGGVARERWVWARVAGDGLDLGTVAAALFRPDAPKARVAGTLAMLLGVAVVDAWCARRLAEARPSRRRGTSRPPRPVRYAEDVETVAPDEDAIIDRIVDVMSTGAEQVRQREGRALRASHAKPAGLLRGELLVEEGLPPELRQGLFAAGRRYPVIVRLAQVPGERLDDRRVSTPRGMAIKVLDVSGEMLPEHRGESTQDFVLDTGEAFISADARSFLGAITATEAAAPLPEAVKAAVSTGSRAANAALHAVGLDSAKLDFFGHPFRHPLGESYYSQCPIRFGDHIAKLAVFPATRELKRLREARFRPADEDGLRTAVTGHFRRKGAEYVLAVQLCTDLDRMPVEDATVVWPEDESPYRPVARLILPPQPAWKGAESEALDEALSFCPAHSLAAHRPLGSIMRARMRAYEALGRKRRELNGRAVAEPERGEA